jgi:hypothetical protein
VAYATVENVVLVVRRDVDGVTSIDHEWRVAADVGFTFTFEHNEYLLTAVRAVRANGASGFQADEAGLHASSLGRAVKDTGKGLRGAEETDDTGLTSSHQIQPKAVKPALAT